MQVGRIPVDLMNLSGPSLAAPDAKPRVTKRIDPVQVRCLLAAVVQKCTHGFTGPCSSLSMRKCFGATSRDTWTV